VSDPDTDLMLRVRAGDDGAFTRLCERFFRPLAHFFHRLGADGSTAEDCAQEVFLKLYRSRLAYEPRAKFTTFLFSVARHHWIDVVRHRAVGPPTVSMDRESSEGEGDDAIRDRVGAAGPRPESRVTDRERDDAIRAAVEALPTEQREVFALAQEAGIKYQDVAEILGIPVGTVKSRMHAAFHALRDRLRRGGIEP
jgi:RNA polymerase sigma-70 factor (ECF subfamily)